MRRTFLLAVAAALVLSACDNSTTPTSATNAPTDTAAPAATAGSFELLDQAKGFYVGKGAGSGKLPTAYVLFDPQCSHCAHLWQNTKPLQADVLVKWIPIGMLNPTSVTQAAMLLEAADPVAMMTANENAFVATQRPSKVTAAVKSETVKLVEQNTSVLEKLKAQAVPTIVYRDRVSGAPVIASGALPTRMLAELFEIPQPASVAN